MHWGKAPPVDSNAAISPPQMAVPGPLLAHAGRLHTASLDELGEAVAAKGVRYALRRGATLAADMRVVHCSGFCMADMSHAGGLQAEVTPTDGYYRLDFGIAGFWRETRGAQAASYGPGTACLVSPSQPQRLELDDTIRRLHLEIRGEAVLRQLADLLDRPVAEPPALPSRLDLGTGPGQSVWRTALFVARELDELGAAPNPLLEAHLQDYLITRLLLLLPHHWSDYLAEAGPTPSPASVRRAVDHVYAHADEPLSVAGLAQVAGVSARTLLRHFQAYRGLSPLAFIRQVRLRRAREDLSAARAGDSVTAVLHRWGFGHAGRFAAEYRARYGETPSQTLQRTRR